MILVIGANFVLSTISITGEAIVNIDKLTYAGNFANLEALAGDGRHEFVKGDIADRGLVRQLFARHRPRENFESGMRKTVDWYLGKK